MTTPVRRLIESRDIDFDSVKLTPHIESLPELRALNPEDFTTALYYEGTRAIVFAYTTSSAASGIESNYGGHWVAKNLSGYTFEYDASTRILRITPDVTENDIPASIHQENLFVQATNNSIAQLSSAVEALRAEVAAGGGGADVDISGLATTEQLQAVQTSVDANTTAIAGKADQTAVDANTTAIAGKADQTAVDANTTAIAGKADQSGVDENTSRLNTLSQQSITLPASGNNESLNFATTESGTLSASLRLTQGVHTIYTANNKVAVSILRESDSTFHSVDSSSAYRVGSRIAVRVNVPSTGDYAVRGGTAIDGSENIGGALVDGTPLRTALATAGDSGDHPQELPEVVSDFFEGASHIHTAGDFIQHQDWSLVKEVTFLGTSPYTATEYGDPTVTVTYNDSNVGHYIAMPNASTHLLVGIEPRTYDNGDVYGYIARDGTDLTDHLAVPLLAINASGHYAVGTGINTSFDAAYQTINDQFGPVSAQTGDQIVLAYLPPANSQETGRVLAVIRRSDGTTIESNDDSLTINYPHPFDSILIHPSEVSVVKIARHDSNSIFHSAVDTLISNTPTSNYTSGENFSIVYGLGTQGTGQDYVDIHTDVRFEGSVTGSDGNTFQGPQGRSREVIFTYESHGSAAPATPIGGTFDGTTFTGLPAGWSGDFPSTQASAPDTYDVYESFTIYDPSNPSDTLVWSVPFKIDADQGIPGARGPKGDKGDTGDAGQGVPTGGSTGQVLAKIDGTDYNTEWVAQTGGTSALPYFITVADTNARFAVATTQLQDGGIIYQRDTQTYWLYRHDDGEGEPFSTEIPAARIITLDSGTTLATVATNTIIRVAAGTYTGRVFIAAFTQSNITAATNFGREGFWVELGGGSSGTPIDTLRIEASGAVPTRTVTLPTDYQTAYDTLYLEITSGTGSDAEDNPNQTFSTDSLSRLPANTSSVIATNDTASIEFNPTTRVITQSAGASDTLFAGYLMPKAQQGEAGAAGDTAAPFGQVILARAPVYATDSSNNLLSSDESQTFLITLTTDIAENGVPYIVHHNASLVTDTNADFTDHLGEVVVRSGKEGAYTYTYTVPENNWTAFIYQNRGVALTDERGSGNQSGSSFNTLIGVAIHQNGEWVVTNTGFVSGSECMSDLAKFSTSIGNNCTARGLSSFAGGSGCISEGGRGFTYGSACRAIGLNSAAFNNSSNATGGSSFAINSNTQATAGGSFAFGGITTAGGMQSCAGGRSTATNKDHTFVIGLNGVLGHDDTAFAIAQGTATPTDAQKTGDADVGIVVKVKRDGHILGSGLSLLDRDTQAETAIPLHSAWQQLTRSSGTDQDGTYPLPDGYTVANIDEISITYGTSSDLNGSDSAVTSTTRNNNRVYTSTVFLPKSATNLIIGGAGAGANNYAVAIASTTYTNTQLDLRAIDMNNGTSTGVRVLQVNVKLVVA